MLVETGKRPGQVKRVGEKKLNDAFGKLSRMLDQFVRGWWKQIERFVWLAGLSNSLQQKAACGSSSRFFYEAKVSIGENKDDDDTPVDRLIYADSFPVVQQGIRQYTQPLYNTLSNVYYSSQVRGQTLVSRS